MSTGYNANSPGIANIEVVSNAALDMAHDSTMELVRAGGETKMTKEDALLYEHPDRGEYCEKWTKYIDCYEAKDIYRFIHKHTRESDGIFDKRVSRGYYFNYVSSVVDLFVSYLFHSPITRQMTASGPVDWNGLYDDADRGGTKFQLFIQLIATFAQIGGHCAVLVDAPQGPEGGYRSEEDRKNAGHRPYLTLVQNHQIMDWKLDKDNKFDWIKIEVFPEQERSWDSEVDLEMRHFLIWSKTSWELWSLSNNEAKLVEDGENPLNEVPIVIVRNERMLTHKWFGLSTVRDISDINIAILNWSSLGDEEVFERCLNILTMEKDESDADTSLSHHNVLEYAPGTQHPPEYLVPGSSPLQMIGDWIDRGKDEIYRLAKLGGTSGLSGMREATSGIAYAFEFNETNQSLARKAESLEQAEIEIHRLYAKWYQQEFDGVITYPKEFGVEDFMQEFMILAEGRTSLSSKTAIKELERKLTSKMFARDSQELRDKISQEIEKSDPQPLGLSESFSSLPPEMLGIPKSGPTGTGKPKTGKTGKGTPPSKSGGK